MAFRSRSRLAWRFKDAINLLHDLVRLLHRGRNQLVALLSLAVGMWLTVKIEAMMPSTRLRPSSVRSMMALSSVLRLGYARTRTGLIKWRHSKRPSHQLSEAGFTGETRQRWGKAMQGPRQYCLEFPL